MSFLRWMEPSVYLHGQYQLLFFQKGTHRSANVPRLAGASFSQFLGGGHSSFDVRAMSRLRKRTLVSWARSHGDHQVVLLAQHLIHAQPAFLKGTFGIKPYPVLQELPVPDSCHLHKLWVL